MLSPGSRIAMLQPPWDGCGVYFTNGTGWDAAAADRAFHKALRARRRSSLLRWLRRGCAKCARLAIYEVRAVTQRGRGGVVREIPLDAITGSVEPNRAAQFDHDFRPFPPTRSRWLRVWLAEHRGAVLPPISVAAVGDGYAVQDGHHRVSVARARGALTIVATIA
jgi:hypothetical protein